MEVAFVFNGDFEDFLKSGTENYKYSSTKKNTEFEYFILWLEKKTLYSIKKYDPNYVSFLELFKEVSIKTNEVKLEPWCCDIYDKEEQKKLNSKIETTKFALKHGFAHPKTEIVNSDAVLDDGYLYKEEFGVSGIGTWEKNNVPKKFSYPIIKEPKLKRTFDFSALYLNDCDEIHIYQNHIDDFFQYKGTTIGLSFDYFDWYEDYLENIKIIIEKFKSRNPMSVDSFLYEENGKENVYTLSEVNNRKTMGYVTLKLKEKFFPKYKYTRLRLFRSKDLIDDIDHSYLFEKFGGKVLPLSPNNNIFFTFLIAEDSLGELNELEDLIVSTFFKNL